MKAIILAAGYGTRLQTALEQAGPEYSHLKGLPKPLLPIANKALIEYLLDEISSIPKIDQTYIVTNSLFAQNFNEWADSYGFPKENIIKNQSISNETRLGAIADLQHTINSKEIDEDVLIIAGDTLFPSEVKLSNIVSHFYQIQANLVTDYQVPDQEVHRRGILELNEQRKIIEMLEKPSTNQTNSRSACPPLYLYTKETIKMIPNFLESTKDMPLKARDAPGNLLSWLQKRTNIYSLHIPGRFDVGNLEQYIEVNRIFSKKLT